MLKLTKAQYEELQRISDKAFIERLLSHLAIHHAEALSLHPEEVRRHRVARGVSRARRHGLTTEASLAAFVAIMFEVAPNFDEHPAIRALLADEHIPPSFKISAVVYKVSHEDWDAAERMADPRAWDAGAVEDR